MSFPVKRFGKVAMKHIVVLALVATLVGACASESQNQANQANLEVANRAQNPTSESLRTFWDDGQVPSVDRSNAPTNPSFRRFTPPTSSAPNSAVR
jgi:outer membrane biogenesis lipoprotein LolB